MQRRALLLLSALALCLLAWLLAVDHSTPVAARATQAPASPSAVDLETRAKAEALEAAQTQARIEDLSRLEAARQKRDQAAASSQQARALLQKSRDAAWSAVITTNWPVYQALRLKAANSPDHHSVPCTICDGHGMMDFCVLCNGLGKCPTCNGTGKSFGDQYCPTCLGKGTCYLCSGMGKMPCPFCDDGTLSLDLPAPSARMPLGGGSISPPAHPKDPRPSPPSPNVPVAPPDPAAEDSETPVLAPASPEAAPAAGIFKETVVALALLVFVIIVFRRLAPRLGDFLNARSDPWDTQATAAGKVSPEVLAEEQNFSAFIAAFQAGPEGSCAQAPSVARTSGQSNENNSSASMQEFFALAAKDLAIARNFLSEIFHSSDLAARKKLLTGLLAQISAFKRKSALPSLLPVWQMAFVLEGLLSQLASKTSDLTPSIQRTVISGVDLLERLCVPGLNASLGANPPLRLLAVEDDPVSRIAIGAALKKGFNQPGLAANGEAALLLAADQSYDVIFLDVEMPGMDGFEVCTRIHQTPLNRSTPVVFVTGQSDFDARSKSTRAGGNDLIAKPFLAFELTVKALTLGLRARLGEGDGSLQFHTETFSRPAPNAEPGVSSTAATPILAPAPVPGNSSPANRLSHQAGVQLLPELPFSSEFVKTFRANALANLQTLRERLAMLAGATDAKLRQGTLEDLYLGLDSFIAGAARAHLQTASHLGAALRGMFKKLLDQPGRFAPSALGIASAALDVLDDLCAGGHNPNLAHPPIRVLVVDDDPISRRAISATLQLAFERPLSAGSGEAALALATEKPFDLIFLDVLMPGMDGFTACAKIHETTHNRLTPVIFVTGRNDPETRAEAVQFGGVGFIEKSAPSAEITVTALTFCVRSRLDQLKPAQTFVVAVS